MTDLTVKEILEATDSLAPLKSQEEYVKNMASFIKMHQMRVNSIEKGMSNLPVFSIMVVAPTGVGKTYVMSQLAKAAGISFITIDCSSLSRTGWRGDNLCTVLYTALSKGDIEDGCIVWFDEFDKLRFGNPQYNDSNAQVNFLKLYDGFITADVDKETKVIDTSKMSFVYSGAFSDLKEQIESKNNPTTVGFCCEQKANADCEITMADIEQYGFMSELCGRIGIIYTLGQPTDADYETLIRGEKGSVLQRYKQLFLPFGIDFDISVAASTYVAEKAKIDHYGARSVAPAFQNVIRECIAELDNLVDVCKITINYSPEKGLYHEFERDKFKRLAKASNFFKDSKLYDDINFAAYRISHNETNIIRKIVRMCPDLTDEQESILRYFLRASIYFLFNETGPEDWTLKNLQTMAKSTYVDEPRLNASAFTHLIEQPLLENKWNDDERTIVKESLKKFRKEYDDKTTRFLVKAIKNVRRQWYKELQKMN